MNKLERQVLLQIGEDPDAPDVFTDDDIGIEQIRTSIADAIAEISMLTGDWVQVFRIPLVADQTFYKLALADDDIGWFVDVFNGDTGDRLTQSSLRELDAWDPRWMLYTGITTQYVPIGTNTIALCPKPSGSTGMLECHIAAIPKRYGTDTDRLRIKRSYERAVVDYAVSEYWASRGAANDAVEHLRRYGQQVGLARVDRGEMGRTYELTTHKIMPSNIALTPGSPIGE